MSIKGDERWLIEVCPYCKEQIHNPPHKLFRGHTHYGCPDVHGHDLPVYVSPQIVEVQRVSRELT